MSTTKIQKRTCKSSNASPVLWLVYDKRLESKVKVQCLVRARLWFEARTKGAADMGVDQQYIDAKTWPSVIGHQTSARMSIGRQHSARVPA